MCGIIMPFSPDFQYHAAGWYEAVSVRGVQEAGDNGKLGFGSGLANDMRRREAHEKEGIRGYLTQMAYGSHAAIPPFDIPDNVLVMVAPFGPWAAARPGGWKRQLDFIQSWKDKVNGKVWLWTYVTKYAGTKILNVPCSTPEAVGRFYTEVQKTYSDHSWSLRQIMPHSSFSTGMCFPKNVGQ